jgi:hypothetical protein
MSFVFDTLQRAWSSRIRPHVPDEELALRFEMLLEELHSANHRLKDAVNHDAGAHKYARELEKYLAGRKESDT